MNAAPALDRGLRLLAYLAQRPDGAGFGELRARFAWPKMTLARLLRVLRAHECVHKDDRDGRYHLGGLTPVHGARGLFDRIGAAAALPALSEDLAATAILVARDGAGMRTIAKQQHPGGATMRAVGSIRYTWLAHPWCWPVVLDLDETARQRLIRRERPSVAQLNALRGARRQLARRGCCWDQAEDWRRLAAPVRTRNGTVLGAFAIAAVNEQLDERVGLPRACALLRRAAEDCSARLAPLTHDVEIDAP